MPVYEYICPNCDLYFTELKSIANSASVSYCPSCAHQANKIISAPHLNTMHRDKRFAHETNERSADKPKVKHTCGSHCHHDKPATADYKQQINKRPWMLGH